MAEKTKQRLQLRKSTATFKIVIPEYVESKIRHLCSIVHDVEWSGTLFYRHEGSIENGDFKVICVDLFVMDIGSSAYTEYDESPDVLSYRVNHNLLGEDIQEGLIHSHNNMSTFFSGTDTNTLIDEGTNSNHFVSLIVNNAGVYTAGVTRRIVTDTVANAHIRYTENEYYDSYGGVRVTLKDNLVREEDRQESKKNQVIEWFELEVEKAFVNNNFEEIDARLAEIRRGKAKPKSTTPKTTQTKPMSSIDRVSTPKKGNLFESDDYYDDWYDYGYGGYYGNYGNYDLNNFTPKKSNPTKEVGTPLYLAESFNRDLVKSLALQLLTGSIIINDNAVDATKWVEKMDTIYEKRFGPLDAMAHPTVSPVVITENNKRLQTWLEAICEFLVFTEDPDLLKRLNDAKGYADFYDSTDTAEICAADLCYYLAALPDSYVKDAMIECLLKYLPNDGAEEYFLSRK